MRSALQVHKLLKASPRSSRLLQIAEQSRRLTYEIQALLPAPLSGYCQAGELQGHTLTIVTTSPVWAAKLRYLIPSLLQAFKSHPALQQATEINTKIVSTPEPDTNQAPARKPRLSPQTAELIRQTAEAIEDPGLRESLLKLSRHSQDETGSD